MNTNMNIYDFDRLAQAVRSALLKSSSMIEALHCVLYDFFNVDLRVEEDGEVLVIELNNHRYIFSASNQKGSK